MTRAAPCPETDAADAVVRLQRLQCRAGGRVTLQLPRLELRAGERVAIVGHNGAGKSTLLRVLSGFERPADGRVEVLGRTLSGPLPRAGLRALRAEVGQVMQGLHLVQRLSALDNVLIGALGRLHGWRSWARLHAPAEVADAERALAAVGLQAKAATRADRLSGGERQKVAIARLLMQRPRLILADEPTASLDPAASREVCRLLIDAAAGATLLTIVHDTELLPLLAERVIGLRGGRLAFDRPLAEVDGAALAALYRADDGGAPTPTPAGAAAGPASPAAPRIATERG